METVLLVPLISSSLLRYPILSILLTHLMLLYLLPCTLLLIPNPLRFHVFLSITSLTILIAGIYTFFAHIFFHFIGRHDLAQYTTSRFWWYITAPITGIETRISGLENLRGWGGKRERSKGPCVFVVNHQSELDILLLARLWQPRSVACAVWRVRSMPVMGWYSRACRTIFVDPPSGLGLTNKGVLSDAAKMMQREGMNLFIFPEGVRSNSKRAELLPFKKGAVAVAIDAGSLPIIPIIVENYAHIFNVPERSFTPGIINVRVLKPVKPDIRKGESKEDAMLRVVESIRIVMLKTLKEISRSASP